jgi:hypothetical protein
VIFLRSVSCGYFMEGPFLSFRRTYGCDALKR